MGLLLEGKKGGMLPNFLLGPKLEAQSLRLIQCTSLLMVHGGPSRLEREIYMMIDLRDEIWGTRWTLGKEVYGICNETNEKMKNSRPGYRTQVFPFASASLYHLAILSFVYINEQNVLY